MSKTNKSETPAERLARLQREMTETRAEIEKTEREHYETIGKKIDELPKIFGVDNLAGVRALIAQREKGTLGALAADKRPRTEFSEAERNAAIEAVRNGTKQRSQIIAELRCHPQTLHNWLKKAGLVNTRTAKQEAPAAPANVTTMPEANAPAPLAAAS